jgi:bifunctional non-homologous end joining protein LigD
MGAFAHDGYRALALRAGGETRILSRNEKDLGSKFPAVRDSIAALDVQDAIIDGEIVALEEKGCSSFQLLQDIAQEKARADPVEGHGGISDNLSLWPT